MGRGDIGTNSISFSARCISLIAMIRCSTACRRAPQQFDGRDIDADLCRLLSPRSRNGSDWAGRLSRSHLDLIKIHGHRPNAEIEAIVGDTLDFIQSRGLAIELSTAGWRKPVNELYPSDRIIELAIAKGIPFTTASDAHSHVQLGENYERLAEKMSTLRDSAKSAFSRGTTRIAAF